MATTPKVRTAPEREDVVRVWNISDWPKTKVASQSVMVLGTTLHPGKGMKVPAERMKNAHKVAKLEEAGIIYVGPRPPAEYLAARSPARARLPKKVNHNHPSAKQRSTAAPAPEAPKPESKAPEKPKVAVRDSVKVSDSVETKATPAKKMKGPKK